MLGIPERRFTKDNRGKVKEESLHVYTVDGNVSVPYIQSINHWSETKPFVSHVRSFYPVKDEEPRLGGSKVLPPWDVQ